MCLGILVWASLLKAGTTASYFEHGCLEGAAPYHHPGVPWWSCKPLKNNSVVRMLPDPFARLRNATFTLSTWMGRVSRQDSRSAPEYWASCAPVILWPTFGYVCGANSLENPEKLRKNVK